MRNGRGEADLGAQRRDHEGSRVELEPVKRHRGSRDTVKRHRGEPGHTNRTPSKPTHPPTRAPDHTRTPGRTRRHKPHRTPHHASSAVVVTEMQMATAPRRGSGNRYRVSSFTGKFTFESEKGEGDNELFCYAQGHSSKSCA
jgi:hypothetical protein